MKEIKNTSNNQPTDDIIRKSSNQFEVGIDELNLCEFPLASISDRYLDGKKTVTFEEKIFDRVERCEVSRRLVLSGSDRYGLPTAKDDDVLLACIQVSKMQDFRSPQVSFSRYELLKMLRWPDESKNYTRLTSSLRRWKGLAIYSDRAFYDFGQKSWVNRDFGIFDSLYIYHRERNQAGLTSNSTATSLSRLTWNEVMFQSFQAGYLKTIDWGLYTRLESAISKRLYRFLDKRFYHRRTLEIGLNELAMNKIRISDDYNTAQIKRVLQRGISELESKWDLKAMKIEERFVKRGRGDWVVRFERSSRTPRVPIVTTTEKELVKAVHIETPQSLASLQIALTKRGIGPANAEELVQRQSTTTVQTMIELFDWYNAHNQPRGVGFLVQSIRFPEKIMLPKGFESSAIQKAESVRKKNVVDARAENDLKLSTMRQKQIARVESSRNGAFLQFWNQLSPIEQTNFEIDAVKLAPSTKRTGYDRHQGKASKLFEHYRTLILRDHFERTAKE